MASGTFSLARQAVPCLSAALNASAQLVKTPWSRFHATPRLFRSSRSSFDHAPLVNHRAVHRVRFANSPVASASKSSQEAETAANDSKPGRVEPANGAASNGSSSNGGSSNGAASNGASTISPRASTNGALAQELDISDLDCVLTGINVECVLPNLADDRDKWEPVAREDGEEGEVGEQRKRKTQQQQTAELVAAGGEAPSGSFLSSFNFDGILETMLLISPFFFWGSSMVAMKDVLPKAGPMFVASVRLIPAGLLLVSFAASRGRPMPKSALAWFSILLFALVDATAFQGCLTEGLRRTSAGLGSVIIDSQPLTVAILAALLFGETISKTGALGLVLGVVGLLLLEVPVDTLLSFTSSLGSSSQSVLATLPLDSTLSLDITPSLADSAATLAAAAESTVVAPPATVASAAAALGGGEWQLWESGEWWMLLAAQSMAVGTVMVRWVCRHSDPIMATGWHMVLGGVPLLLLSFQQHDPAVSGHLSDLSLLDWSSLVYTSVFGSAISYGVFFYNANKGNLTRLSSLTFLTPAFAAFFGFVFLGETLSPLQFFGAGVTLVAIYLVNARSQQTT
ncbi:hypothetical protein CLOM_g14 [Closterium sp. NIES-68]|nr:hypothetical protein CLOM_g14 [Closterium sp. NIES-68]GJP73577.1 hypothetical protein CLOP_g4270 [Closterium sp. NIES-67]